MQEAEAEQQQLLEVYGLMANTPRYQRLTLLLKEKLTSGEFKVGDRFFSQTELMKKYTLSFATVTRALKELEREGYIVRMQGRGTFVQATEQSASNNPSNSQTVCVFIPWDARVPSHINYRTLYRGMENSRLSFMNLKLIPYSMKPEDLEPFLFSRDPIGGVIFVYPEEVHFSLIRKFARQHPTVVIGSDLSEDNIGCVWTDNKAAAEQAVQHLIDLGHKNIGIISAPLAITDAAERLEGYKSALEKNGIPYDDSSVVFTNPIDLNGYSGCVNLFSRNHDVTALFAAGDVIAMGVFAAAKALGRIIPKELSVVGFDDTDYALEMKPSLTTIHVPYEDMACKAVAILANLIQTGKVESACLSAPLVVRKSAAKLAAAVKKPIAKT